MLREWFYVLITPSSCLHACSSQRCSPSLNSPPPNTHTHTHTKHVCQHLRENKWFEIELQCSTLSHIPFIVSIPCGAIWEQTVACVPELVQGGGEESRYL
jgi:hypothetical protein